MRVRPLVVSATPAALLAALLAAGCGDPSAKAPADSKAVADGTPVDVGGLLYPVKPPVVIKAPQSGAAEALVLPNCTVQYDLRQVVAAEVDGKIDLLGYHDPAIDPKDPDCVYHWRDVAAAQKDPNHPVPKYRLLKEGMTVKADQVLCLLDDQIITTRMEAAGMAEAAAVSIAKSATEGVEYTKDKMALTKTAILQNGASKADYLGDQITLTRFEENLGNARQAISKAQSDRKEAGVMLNKHKIAGSMNGFVRTIAKHKGEFVKAGDKILEVQATDVVRLEGNLDVQYAGAVRQGMTVTVEPGVPSAPAKTRYTHRSEVTGVAVTADPARPLVVSAGADGAAWVWDVTRDAPDHALPHPAAVRAVACSPAGVKPAVAVTGADDGKVRVWDLSDPDKLSADPKVLADAHAAAVGAVAFSPDGRYFATAAGRDVFVWAADGRKLYSLPADHRDAVTALAFTPQGTLVTASKDRSLKVWALGADRAAVTHTLDHRAGVIDHLGVTKDGGRVVFDQDKGRLDLIGLADRRTTGQVQNLGPTAGFSTLAVFNRDDTLLVTAGGEGELKGGLQVWKVPADGGRGTEEARLFTTGRVGVTAAAFGLSAGPLDAADRKEAADRQAAGKAAKKDYPFLVVGTEKGAVHLWKSPSPDRKAYTGKVVNVDPTDPKYVSVRVEMDNRELHLPDRSAATVIINPGQ